MRDFSPKLVLKSSLTTSVHHYLMLHGELTIQLPGFVLILEVFLSCPIKRELCLLGEKRMEFVPPSTV